MHLAHHKFVCLISGIVCYVSPDEDVAKTGFKSRIDRFVVRFHRTPPAVEQIPPCHIRAGAVVKIVYPVKSFIDIARRIGKLDFYLQIGKRGAGGAERLYRIYLKRTALRSYPVDIAGNRVSRHGKRFPLVERTYLKVDRRCYIRKRILDLDVGRPRPLLARRHRFHPRRRNGICGNQKNCKNRNRSFHGHNSFQCSAHCFATGQTTRKPTKVFD